MHFVMLSRPISDKIFSERIQAEDRCHRIGQTQRVTYISIWADCSIDNRICNALASKGDAVRQFRDEVDKIKDSKDIDFRKYFPIINVNRHPMGRQLPSARRGIMAKSYITCATEGCDNEIIIFGNNRKEADRKAEWAEGSYVCDECRQKQLIDADKQAAADNVEAGLPELTGSEKQVLWAEKIRTDKLALLESMANQPPYMVDAWFEWTAFRPFFTEQQMDAIKSANPGPAQRMNALLAEPLLAEAVEVMKQKTVASWWIDHRAAKLSAMLVDLIKNAKPQSDPVTQELELAAQAEATVRPEQPETETVAEIQTHRDSVTVHFPEKIEEFRLLMRKHGFAWTGSVWKRALNDRNGEPSARAAEIGHVLLGSGFIIRIYDEKTRHMAIDGHYPEEQTRWITCYTSGENKGRLCINWGRDEDYYRAAKRMPTAKYVKPSISVAAEQFEQVLDFAEVNGFSISDTAQQYIDAARAAKEAAIVAHVDTPTDKPKTVGQSKPGKLDAPESVDIDDSLRD